MRVHELLAGMSDRREGLSSTGLVSRAGKKRRGTVRVEVSSKA
jgi:hypothetical protein